MNGYSIRNIADAWGVSPQVVNYYRAAELIKPDVETSAGPIWFQIPDKPEPKRRGPKPKSVTGAHKE